MALKLSDNERAFIQEGQSSLKGYLQMQINPTSQMLRDDSREVALSIAGIFIDAAHFNNAEDSPYTFILSALAAQLAKCSPKELPIAAHFIEGTLRTLLEYDEETKDRKG